VTRLEGPEEVAFALAKATVSKDGGKLGVPALALRDAVLRTALRVRAPILRSYPEEVALRFSEGDRLEGWPNTRCAWPWFETPRYTRLLVLARSDILQAFREE
jgi:hypothetical protein